MCGTAFFGSWNGLFRTAEKHVSQHIGNQFVVRCGVSLAINIKLLTKQASADGRQVYVTFADIHILIIICKGMIVMG